MAKCGAKKRNGGECKGQAMPNGKCRLHGGASTGAPEGNQNATKHGFYSNCYTETEKANLAEIKHGTLIAELALARTQLARAASAPEFEEGSTTKRNEHYRPDVIERLLNTVGRLEKQHAEITAGDETDGLDWAAIAKVGSYLTEEVDSIKISRRAKPANNGKQKI